MLFAKFQLGLLCEQCWSTSQETVANLGVLKRKTDSKLQSTQLACASCTGSVSTEPIGCESLDCEWFYARIRAEAKTEFVPLYDDVIVELELDMDEQLSQT